MNREAMALERDGAESGKRRGVREDSPEIHFLGIDAEKGRPFYSLERLDEPPPRIRHRPLRAGVSSTLLGEAGWGVVLPKGLNPAIRTALKPLLARRHAQAGALYRELIYVPREGPGHFLSRLHAGPGPVVPTTVPYYLLLVGDPTEIPPGFQFDLSLQYAVGRIDFDTVESYAHYANSVVRAEEQGRPHEMALEIFSMGHPGDAATEIVREQLVEPLHGPLKERFPSKEIRWTDGAAATKAALGEAVREGHASMVFTAGHAALFSEGSPRQKVCQGALVCADWPGEGPAKSSQYFSALDLSEEADLIGRLFFLFGCHTAGTPRLDTFGPPGPGGRKQRRKLTDEPFIARLPQALLGHPEGGALAVVAHIDRAFPAHRFGEFSDGQAHVFGDVFVQLLQGKPLGVAMESFSLRHAELAARLVSQVLEAGDGDFEPLDQAALWTAFSDARSLIVLGDPAVRLTTEDDRRSSRDTSQEKDLENRVESLEARLVPIERE